MLPGRDELSRLLTDACERHGVPGAVAAVARAGELVVAPAGVVRAPGGAAVTADTLFLIGSITKVWTATMIMQLVDEGALELDAPVQRHLDPPLILADAEVADAVTVRQLLSHTGGFRGDADDPPDRGDDAVRRTVASYATLPQVHRPGRLFSYSNTGYTVLGRLIECLTGTTWDEALRTRVLEPLGLARSSTLPERTMVHPVAVGHEADEQGRAAAPVATWLSPRGSGPCGGTLAATAEDLLVFARAHMADGRGPDGRRLLSAASARLMRTPQVHLNEPMLGAAWGLGWEIERLADPLIVGHSGSTDGQQARLVAVPDQDLAACVLTNGDPSTKLRHEVLDELLRRLAGVGLPAPPTPSDEELDDALARRCSGRYGDGDETAVVTLRDGRLHVRQVGVPAERVLPDADTPLIPAGGATFLAQAVALDVPLTFVSEQGDGGPPTHLMILGRALPRTG